MGKTIICPQGHIIVKDFVFIEQNIAKGIDFKRR